MSLERYTQQPNLISELVEGLLDRGESLSLVGNSLCPQLKSSLLALEEHLALFAVKKNRRKKNVTTSSKGSNEKGGGW